MSEYHIIYWTQAKIIQNEENLVQKKFKKAVHVMASKEVISEPSVQIKKNWEPLIEKQRSQLKRHQIMYEYVQRYI